MYFDLNLKLLSGKKYSKSKQTKNLGFVKLGVRWAERDTKFQIQVHQVFISQKFKKLKEEENLPFGPTGSADSL